MTKVGTTIVLFFILVGIAIFIANSKWNSDVTITILHTTKVWEKHDDFYKSKGKKPLGILNSGDIVVSNTQVYGKDYLAYKIKIADKSGYIIHSKDIKTNINE